MEALEYLNVLEKKLMDEGTLPLYQGSPFDNYQSGNLETFKSIVISFVSAYLEKHSGDLTDLQKEQILIFVENIAASNQYSAVYTHLSMGLRSFAELDTLSALLTHSRNYPMFIRDVRHQRYLSPEMGKKPVDQSKTAAVYHNPIEAAVFESELAHALLVAAPKESAAKVNAAIIDYSLKHQKDLLQDKGEILRSELIKHNVCTGHAFKDKDPVSVFIELLQKPLSDPHAVSEMATLHRIFFNCQHIYDPTLDAVDDGSKKDIASRRDEIHRTVRPEKPGEMFDTSLRDSARIFASKPSREFGITDPANAPDWAKNWHTNESTPYKYRATVNTQSPVLKSFRTNGIPYVTGPSETAADCAEGLKFLLPEMTSTESQEYFNLLAAAEVAQGHHSIHETIMPLCNLDLYAPYAEKVAELQSKNQMGRVRDYTTHPWAHLDYSRSYEQFLSPTFKESPAYKVLCSKYPQYLDPARHDSETLDKYLFTKDTPTSPSMAVKIQRAYRATSAYAELKSGEYWKEAVSTADISMNLKSFRALSKKNLSKLETELGMLSKQEMNFIRSFYRQSVELTHYTAASDKIFESGMMLSNTALKKYLGDGNYTDNSQLDMNRLANGSQVYFRYELQHDNVGASRFGEAHIIIDSDSTALEQTGWVSMYEMLDPTLTSIVQKLVENGKPLRELLGPYEGGMLEYRYGSQTYEFDVAGTVFYGPDIKRGIALVLIRELRRIGGDYKESGLTDVSPEALNKLLSRLLRVEAKIPFLVSMANVSYKFVDPIGMRAAIEANDTTAIQNILDKRMEIDAPISGGQSALFYALSQRDDASLVAVKYLCERGASLINSKTTAGHVAARYGNLECLKYCLEQGITVDTQDEKGRTLLSYASEHGKIHIAKYLITSGAKPTVENIVRAINGGHIDILQVYFAAFPELVNECKAWRNSEGNSLAHQAASKGFSAIIRTLREFEISVTEQNDADQTILHAAILSGKYDIVREIIEAGVDVGTVDKHGQTAFNVKVLGVPALHAAIRTGDPSNVAVLLDNAADPNSVNDMTGDSALHEAIKSGNLHVVQLLMHKNVDLMVSNKNQQSVVDYVIEYGTEQISQEVLSRIDPNAKDEFGKTLAHKAVDSANKQLLSALAENKQIDFTIPDNDGMTPLHTAVLSCEKTSVKILLSNKHKPPDVFLNKKNQTPLHAAVTNEKTANFIVSLLKSGADPYWEDSEKLTPVLLAVRNNCVQAIQEFKGAGINFNKKNAQGITPLFIAMQNKSDITISLLLSYGVNPNFEEAKQLFQMTRQSLELQPNTTNKYFKLLNQSGMEKIISQLGTEDNRLRMKLIECAMEKGYTDLVVRMLKDVHDINEADSIGSTLLQSACSAQTPKLDMIQLLLGKGADPSLGIEESNSPIDLAIRNKQWPIVIHLLLAMKNHLSPKTVERLMAVQPELVTHILKLAPGSESAELIKNIHPDRENVLAMLLSRAPYTPGMFHQRSISGYNQIINHFDTQETDATLLRSPSGKASGQ